MTARPGWNPGRRNRHVGTPAHGHGEDNRLTVPESRHDSRRFYEQLGAFVPVRMRIGAREIAVLVEPTRPGWFHPATVDDVHSVLAGVPADDLETIDLVVMRQPTRKQRILRPVWGRAVFHFDVDAFDGSAIVLEAQTVEPFTWSLSLTPEDARELDRLAADGHRIVRGRRRYEISPTQESLRNTVLFRTLLHELGHHVDFRDCDLEEWRTRTPSRKEDFAHRYAATTLARLRSEGTCPFPPRIDTNGMEGLGLEAGWFGLAKTT